MTRIRVLVRPDGDTVVSDGRRRTRKVITKRGRPHLRRRYLLDPAVDPVGLMVHRIDQPDADRHLHDHPWWFVAVVLRGGYEQVRTTRRGGVRRARVRRVNAVGRRTFHRIESVEPGTVTLVLTGRVQRTWAYRVEWDRIHPGDWADAADNAGWNDR